MLALLRVQQKHCDMTRFFASQKLRACQINFKNDRRPATLPVSCVLNHCSGGLTLRNSLGKIFSLEKI